MTKGKGWRKPTTNTPAQREKVMKVINDIAGKMENGFVLIFSETTSELSMMNIGLSPMNVLLVLKRAITDQKKLIDMTVTEILKEKAKGTKGEAS